VTSAAPWPTWQAAIRRYLIAVVAGNLLWEFAQMPLYTLGQTGTPREIILGGLHCTAGDVLIAAAALLISLLLFRANGWPGRRYAPVAVASATIGVGYTLFSEYLNTVVRHAWSYAGSMPTLPWLGTGVAPLIQWLLIPPAALAWACGRLHR
jgi:hypothetical protein